MGQRERDTSVELLRVIGACMVIGTHIDLAATIEGTTRFSRVWISCVVGDGVAVFWMILGFFYFRQEDWRRRCGRLLRRIILPMAAFSALMFFFYDFIMGEGLLQSLRHAPREYLHALGSSLLRWQSAVPGTGHFWYLYVYILVVLAWPVLRPVRDALEPDAAHERRLLTVLFALLVYNDVTVNNFFRFSHHTFGGLLGAAVWVLIGDIVYRRRALLQGNARLGWAGLAVFVGVNLLRAFVQYRLLLSDPENTHPMFWYTSFAVAAVLGLTAFVFGVLEPLTRGAAGKVIRYLGGRTFSVYIWHMVVVHKLSAMGLGKWLAARLGVEGIGAVGYEIAALLIVFLVSLAISEICAQLWRPVRRALERAFRRGAAA